MTSAIQEQELTKDLNIWNFLILRGGSRIIPPAEASLVLMLLGSSVARMTLEYLQVVDQFWIPFSQNYCLAETKLL